MKRLFLVCALLLATSAALGAQQSSQSNPYEGVSHPPPDDTITTYTAPVPKPPAGKPAPAQPAPAPAQAPAQTPAQAEPQPAPAQAASEPGSPAVSPNEFAPGTDGGIVVVEPDNTTTEPQPGLNQSPQNQPALNQRAYMDDPDGDIVHPEPLPPGELGEGTSIRVELLQRLSTAYNQGGDTFRTRVASDVLQDGQVLIPAGSEIDGTVVRVSSGHFGGHGSMHLRPETVILPNGSRYRLYAQVSGTPDSNTRVGSEGTITPGSRLKKDSIEYGGAVGAGSVTGAILAGPAGALAGTLIGAGAITAHLLLDHPQATLEPGTTLLFSLTQPLDLVPASQAQTSVTPQTRHE